MLAHLQTVNAVTFTVIVLQLGWAKSVHQTRAVCRVDVFSEVNYYSKKTYIYEVFGTSYYIVDKC